MQRVNFEGCEDLTGTAELGGVRFIFKIVFEASRTRFLIPHFILFPLFAFFSAGEVDKMVLPEGMQTVDFSDCWRITGTAELGMSKVHTF